jgi:ketosteroid isomerase-like protein
MSQDNVDVVRRAIAAFNRGELDTIADTYDWYHPDLEFLEDPSHPDHAAHRGPGAIEAYFRNFIDLFDDYRFEIEEIVDAGDKVVVVNRQRARSSGRGGEVDMRNTWVFEFRDDRIARITPYWDRATALAAVGLAE